MRLFKKKPQNTKIKNIKEQPTGIKNIKKVEYTIDNKKQITYTYSQGNWSTNMGYFELLLKSLEQDNIDLIVEDEKLFHRSILQSRKHMYQEHCNMLGIVEDKDPDSFYDLYSEWPVPGGKWTIIKFDGSERFTIQRKDKASVLELVDDLNNGRQFPFKIIETDYSNK